MEWERKMKYFLKSGKIKRIALVSGKEGEIWSVFFITAHECLSSKLVFY